MGESPKITDPLKALEQARRQFEEAEDFTIAVEEEFAILDADSLEMTAAGSRPAGPPPAADLSRRSRAGSPAS